MLEVYFLLDGEIVKLCESRIGEAKKGEIGVINNIYKDGIGVMCEDKEIIITRLKPNGKKEMSAQDYINGKKKENLIGKKLS